MSPLSVDLCIEGVHNNNIRSQFYYRIYIYIFNLVDSYLNFPTMTKGTSNQNVNTPQHHHQQLRPGSSYEIDNGDKKNTDHDVIHGNTTNSTKWETIQNTTIPTSTTSTTIHSTIVPSLLLSIRFTLGITIILYVLNQQHLLPKQLSSIVSQTLFWPTLPITLSKRLGKWYTEIDDTIIMGGAPFNFMKLPELLYDKYKVKYIYFSCFFFI
jgi:hypothetical protein